MNIKTFEVEHEPTGGSITVQIDFDHVNNFGKGPIDMNSTIKMMVDFWANQYQRLTDNGNVYLDAFLKQLCQECLCICAEYPYGISGLVKCFNNREGYCSMDGSNGIRITAVENMDLYPQDNYTIKNFEPLHA